MARDIPISGLPLLVYKLRTGGVPWLVKRLSREWDLPTTGSGQVLYRVARGLRRLAGPADRGPALPDGVLYAFYDLAVAPITFDFLWFLVGAELARQRRGLGSVHAVIVPGRQAGLREEDPHYDQFIDAAARRARIGNILLPACALLPSLAAVTFPARQTPASISPAASP